MGQSGMKGLAVTANTALFQMRVTSRVTRSVGSSRSEKNPRPGNPHADNAE